MKMTKTLLALLLTLVLTLSLFGALAESEGVAPEATETVETTETTPEEGSGVEAAPSENFFANLKLTYLDGTPFDASVFQGKPTLLNFWATWCPPCIGEMPHLNELAEEYKDKINIVGVQVDGLMMTQEGQITVDQDKTEAAIKLQQEQGLTFPLVNPDENLFILVNVPDYGVQVTAVPTTWLLDGDGFVRDILVSAYDKEQWSQIIDTFLEDLTKLEAEEGNNEG